MKREINGAQKTTIYLTESTKRQLMHFCKAFGVEYKASFAIRELAKMFTESYCRKNDINPMDLEKEGAYKSDTGYRKIIPLMEIKTNDDNNSKNYIIKPGSQWVEKTAKGTPVLRHEIRIINGEEIEYLDDLPASEYPGSLTEDYVETMYRDEGRE